MKKTFTLLLALAMLLPCLLEAQVEPVRIIVSGVNGVNIEIDGLEANYGPNFPATLTAPVVWANDGVTETTDGDTWSAMGSYTCAAVTNTEAVSGSIAMISRGACEFGVKSLNAEEAGAVAVIVGNRAPLSATVGTHTDGLIWMGGGAVGDSVTIPSLFITYEDREILAGLMETMSPLEITIEKPFMYDVAVARAASVPDGQAGTLDSISVIAINRDTIAVTDVTFTADITQPDGSTLSLTAVLDTLAPPVGDVSGEVQVFFPSFTPTAVGTYEVSITASTASGDHPLDEETIFTSFSVNDNFTFRTDSDELGSYPSIELNNEIYISETASTIFNIGSFFRTGESTQAIAASFALDNPGELTEDLEFTFSLYDADPDGDGNLDNDASGVVDQNDVYAEAAVATGVYTMTGTETASSLLSVDFEAPATLAENHTYLLMISHSGLEGDNFTSPAYTVSGYTNYTDYNTVVEWGQEGSDTYQFEVDGFEYWNDDTPGFPHGGPHPVTRLHTEGFVGVQDLPALAASKIQLSPNPATVETQLTFDLENTADEVLVRLLDINGQLIRTAIYENVKNETYNVSVKDLATGTYFLSIITPEGYRAKKLVVGK